MPTIRDVAKRAGVAPITVSRVINRSGAVSEETRRRVEAATAELLLSRVAGRGPPSFQEIVLPTKVVFRESCKPLSAP